MSRRKSSCSGIRIEWPICTSRYSNIPPQNGGSTRTGFQPQDQTEGTIMNRVLNILLVDDNPDDRSLVIRELSEEFPDGQFSQVTDLRQLTLALERGPCDLVVTDYQLRWSDGLKVLMSVKSRWPECPVIMFTGTGSEEIAVQAMKAGLDDYVLKSPKHYARLPAAAVMALDRAKQRRALREAETRYQHLFNRVPVGLFCATPGGRITDANPAMVEMLGYPDREALLAVD